MILIGFVVFLVVLVVGSVFVCASDPNAKWPNNE